MATSTAASEAAGNVNVLLIVSLDKQWIAAVRAGNVFLRSAQGREAVSVSFNGDTTNPYGHLQWSPDSKHLVVLHIFSVAEKPVYFVLSSVDTTMRGVLRSHEYAQPGDPFTGYEMFTINIGDKKLVNVDTELYNFLEFPWINWRSGDNNFSLLKRPIAAISVFHAPKYQLSYGHKKSSTFL